MDAQEFLKQYERQNRKFPWASLNQVDLSDAQIPNVNLSRSQLQEAILIRVNLSGSNLIKADLTNANLTSADLSGVNFYKANLTGAILEGAILEGANLTGVNLDEVYLNGAIMPDGKPYEEWILQENPCLNPNLEALNDENEALLNLSGETENSSQFATATPPLMPIFAHQKEPPPDLADLQITEAKFWQSLPRIPFTFLSVGYIFYGMIFSNFSANPFFWLLAWLGSLIWYLDDALIWCVPLTGAIAVLISMYLNPLILILSFVNFVMLFIGLLTMSFTKRKALLDAVLGTAIYMIILLLLASLIVGNPDYGDYNVFFNILSIPFALVIGLACSLLGSNVWIPMKLAGFTKKQTLKVFALITATSLIFGGLLELIF